MTYRFTSVPSGPNGTYLPYHASFLVVNSDSVVQEFSARIMYFRESADGSGAVKIVSGMMWAMVVVSLYLIF